MVVLSWLKCHHVERSSLSTLFKTNKLPLQLSSFSFIVGITLWPITTTVNLMFFSFLLPPQTHYNIISTRGDIYIYFVCCSILSPIYEAWGFVQYIFNWTNESFNQSIGDRHGILHGLHIPMHMCVHAGISACSVHISVITCRKYSLSTSLEDLRFIHRLHYYILTLLAWLLESSRARTLGPCLCSG